MDDEVSPTSLQPIIEIDSEDVEMLTNNYKYEEFIEMIKSGEVDLLYQVILNKEFDFNLETLFSFVLPQKFSKTNHPNPFYPVKEIVEFIENGGDELFRLLKEDEFDEIYKWSKTHDIGLQHPITGDTVFHHQYSLCNLFNDEQLINIHNRLNFDGESIAVGFK